MRIPEALLVRDINAPPVETMHEFVNVQTKVIDIDVGEGLSMLVVLRFYVDEPVLTPADSIK
ncbi:hypothetical protein KI387_005076, partial [Taxus chinensis]